MARLDQKIGRGAKKVWNKATGVVEDTFTQQPVTPYDPNASNYHAFGDQNYAQGRATYNQNVGAYQDTARSYAADARALNTNNADVSRGFAQQDRGATVDSIGQVQADAGLVRGVGGQMVDYANQGPGPSAAEAQLKMAQDRNMRNAVALARSGRGGTGGALALRQADQARAQAQTDTAAQTSLLRAQESDAWRGRQLEALRGGAAAYGAAGGLSDSATGSYLAQQQADQGMYGLDIDQQRAHLQQQQQNDAAALGWEDRAQGREQIAQGYAAQDQAGRTQYEETRGGNIMDAQLAAAGYDTQRDSALLGMTAGLGSAALMMSDIRNKRRIRPEQGIPNQISPLLSSGVGSLTDAMKARSAESEAQALSDKRTAQSSGAAALAAAEAAPGYSYEYKDPKNGEGRYVGPMAQDLEKTPAGRSVVEDGPNGKQIDTARLSLVNTAAVSEQQREIDELRRHLAALNGAAA